MKVFYSNHQTRQEKVRFILHLSYLCRIRDDKKRPDPGSGINIPDPQHCFIGILNTGTVTGTIFIAFLYSWAIIFHNFLDPPS
jgi:hypothetical protein